MNTNAAPACSEGLRGADGRLYPGWTTTGAALVGLALGPSAMLVFAYSSFVPALERAFGWSIAALSFGATLVMVMTVVGTVIGGALSDRLGPRRLVLASMPLFAAGLASLALLGPDIRGFYASLVLIGLAAVGVWPVTYNQLTSQWFDRRLGLSLGLANAGLALGAAALPALAAWLIATQGWRAAYAVLGALALLLPWPLAWFGLKQRPLAARPAAGPRDALGASLDFAAVRRTREFWLALAGFAMLGAASSSVVVHQMRILTDSGMSAPAAIAMQSVIGVAMLVGRLCTGWLLDRLRAALIMVVLCGSGAVALALLAAGAPMGSALPCAIVVGVLIGAEFDVLGYLIPRYFGRGAFGIVYGIVFGAFQVSAGLTIGLLGWSRAASGSYAAGLSVVAVLLVIGGGCFALFGPYRFAPPEAAAGPAR